MSVTQFLIDGHLIKNPTSFTIERYNLTKSGRLASGLMCMDLIAKKRKFLFRYDVISSDDLNTILTYIDGTAMFFVLTYVENGTTKTATCYAGSIPAKLHRTGSTWYWKEISFDLIER